MNDPSAANAALNAFLRGVERRGIVFAEWQGGDAEAGDAALAATLRGFGAVAAGIPFAEWPRRFWAMLLAAPELRGPVMAQATPAMSAAPAHLAQLGSGPRAALLLRLVAGLAESEAAAVSSSTVTVAGHSQRGRGPAIVEGSTGRGFGRRPSRNSAMRCRRSPGTARSAACAVSDMARHASWSGLPSSRSGSARCSASR